MRQYFVLEGLNFVLNNCLLKLTFSSHRADLDDLL